MIRRSRSTHANNHKIFTVSYFEREFLGALLGHFIYILSLTMQHERLDHIRHSKADIFVTIFFEVYIFMLVHIVRQHEQRWLLLQVSPDRLSENKTTTSKAALWMLYFFWRNCLNQHHVYIYTNSIGGKKKWPETLACHKNLLRTITQPSCLCFLNFCTVSIIKRLNYFPLQLIIFYAGKPRVQ